MLNTIQKKIMIHLAALIFSAITCALFSAAALHWFLLGLPNLNRRERYAIAFSFFIMAAMAYFAVLSKIQTT